MKCMFASSIQHRFTPYNVGLLDLVNYWLFSIACDPSHVYKDAYISIVICIVGTVGFENLLV